MNILPFRDAAKLRITNPYGVVNSQYEAGYHSGLDVVSDGDKTIIAIRAGRVIRSQSYGSWGNYVVVQQNDGLYCIYAHLRERYVSYGSQVSEGQMIGVEGATGNATGTHLHLELQKSYYDPKSSVNPAEYLGIANEIGPVRYLLEFVKELEIRKNGQSFWGLLLNRAGQSLAVVELRKFAESDGYNVIANIDEGLVIVEK